MQEVTLNEKTPLILIVDDIPKNLQVLSNILNTEGYQIAFASHGRQALTVVQHSLPDLILLDIMMPEIDGYQVCEMLKAAESTRDIPVIFLTGKAETEDIAKGFKCGAVDYITKPFNAIELLSRVKTHLDLKLSKDAIVEYNKRLKAYQEDLQQAIASKDKFFSIIAHDLRGPFTGFIGLSELLLDESANLSKDDVVNIAQNMHKAAKKLFNFLENLLEWSRAQMGRIDFNPNKFTLFELIRRTISLNRETAQNKNIELVSAVGESLYAYGDSNMFNTIMRNIVSNALKFTKEGGKVEVTAEDINDDFIVISVIDNGIGMSEDALSKIFRIDMKYTTPGTNKESGSGLGLILCKELVDKLSGKIEVFSVQGEGTTFKITLPKKP